MMKGPSAFLRIKVEPASRIAFKWKFSVYFYLRYITFNISLIYVIAVRNNVVGIFLFIYLFNFRVELKKNNTSYSTLRRILKALRVDWTLRHAFPFYQSEEMKIFNILLPRLEIKPTIVTSTVILSLALVLR